MISLIAAISLIFAPVSASAVAQRTVEHPENLPVQDTTTTSAPAVPDWAQCPEFYQMALDVGWPEDQMHTVMYVMHRESRCQPGAYNSSGAKGLMQLLGWSCPPNGCFDPWSNLSKALELWRSSGWRPWCLAGDRVTGNC